MILGGRTLPVPGLNITSCLKAIITLPGSMDFLKSAMIPDYFGVLENIGCLKMADITFIRFNWDLNWIFLKHPINHYDFEQMPEIHACHSTLFLTLYSGGYFMLRFFVSLTHFSSSGVLVLGALA